MEYDLLIQRILRGQGFSAEMARYFAAVSRHETGNYESVVLKRSKNLFGMKHPVPAFAIGASGRDAGEFVPLRVVVVMIAVGQRRPDHLRHGVSQDPKAFFADAERGFGRTAGGKAGKLLAAADEPAHDRLRQGIECFEL